MDSLKQVDSVCEDYDVRFSLSLSRFPASVVNQAGLEIFATHAHQKRDVVSSHTFLNTHTERLIARCGLFSSFLSYETRPSTLIIMRDQRQVLVYMMNGRAPYK